MAEIEVEFGQSHTEVHAMAFTDADKDRILQNFPDKISVSVANFGTQEFPLRAYVKSFLDAVQPPSAKVVITVEADGDDLDMATIDNTHVKLIGINAANFQIADTEVSYYFDATLEAEDNMVEDCTCADGREGQRLSRAFKLVWDIGIDVDPGISGVFEVSESEIVVVTPCVCPPEEPILAEGEDEADDGDDDHGDKKHKKKGKRDK
jgi:hypothetical protein